MKPPETPFLKQSLSVRTLDLEADFVEIRMQLDEILTQVSARRALSAELATGISNEAT